MVLFASKQIIRRKVEISRLNSSWSHHLNTLSDELLAEGSPLTLTDMAVEMLMVLCWGNSTPNSPGTSDALLA